MSDKKTSCPECGGPSSLLYKNVRSYYADKDYDIFKCAECSLCFTFPFGIEKSFYSEEGYGYQRRKLQNRERKFRNKYYASLISKYARNRVLEIGCQFGELLAEIKSDFFVEGVELAKEPCLEVKNKGIHCFNGTIEGYAEVCQEQFDTVVSFHTIEHLTGLKSFFSAIKKVIAEDGTLILAMPNFEESKRLKGNWGWTLVPAHQYHFTRSSINSALEKNGFEIREILYRGGDASFYLSSLYNILGLKGSKKVNLPASRPLASPRGEQGGLASRIAFSLFYLLISRVMFNRGKEEILVVAKRRDSHF